MRTAALLAISTILIMLVIAGLKNVAVEHMSVTAQPTDYLERARVASEIPSPASSCAAMSDTALASCGTQLLSYDATTKRSGVRDHLTVGGDVNVQKRLFFSDPSMSTGGDWNNNSSDPYFLEKRSTGANQSSLRMTINDDADETFQIWGNSCGVGNCGGEGAMQHSFKADGTAEHRGYMYLGPQGDVAALEMRRWGDNQSLDVTGALNKATGDRQMRVHDAVVVGGRGEPGVGYLGVAGKGPKYGCIETNYGDKTKETNAGKICYQGWTDALDIVGAGTGWPGRKVRVHDDLQAQGSLGASTCLQLGANLNVTNDPNADPKTNREIRAGSICYQGWTKDALDIKGAGTSYPNRKVKLWDHVEVDQSLKVNSGANVGGRLQVESGDMTWGGAGGVGCINWKTNKGDQKLCFQSDGNLVIYRGHRPMWHSGSFVN
jgi:hypothetical protein